MLKPDLILPVLLGEFYEKLKTLKDLVRRDEQFPDLPNKIKIAIGMRRTGKTYFLLQKAVDLIESGIDIKTILFINFEDDRLALYNDHKLAKLVDAFYTLNPENHDRRCYFFFDEIQNVENWPLIVRRLHDTKNAEIFLTGSSAKLLSREIATSLRGRSFASEIWPYSFNEYMRAKKMTIDRTLFDSKTKDKLTQWFQHYLSEGGFPETVSYTQDIRQKVLQDYLDVVIYRDIIERHDIKNPTVIKNMILSMVNNVGKPFAIIKFHNDLKSRGYKISKDMLYEYADYIEDAFVAFLIPVFDKSHRKSQTKPKKLYSIDPGMMRALTLDYENDRGRLFENVIFLELKRLGYQVNYYVTREGYEVDFVAQTRRGRKKLFQIAWDVEDDTTMAREHRALEAGMKELRSDGEIITLASYLQKGIMMESEA